MGHLVGFGWGWGAEPEASKPGPGSQAGDYFYSSVHGTWPRLNYAICLPLPLSSWQAHGGHCGGLGEVGGVGILLWAGVGLPSILLASGLGCVGGVLRGGSCQAWGRGW